VLAAPNELHDFVAVAGFYWRLCPCGAREYFQVSLDGHAAGVQTERQEQIGDHRAGICFALFSIDHNRNRCLHRQV
jgi:hypothetical protein